MFGVCFARRLSGRFACGSGGRGFRLVHLAHYADDAARDGEVVALVHDDGAVLRVGGPELDVVVLRLVVLDGRFVVDLRHDDFAAFGGFLLAGEDEVAVEDAGVDQGSRGRW